MHRRFALTIRQNDLHSTNQCAARHRHCFRQCRHRQSAATQSHSHRSCSRHRAAPHRHLRQHQSRLQQWSSYLQPHLRSATSPMQPTKYRRYHQKLHRQAVRQVHPHHSRQHPQRYGPSRRCHPWKTLNAQTRSRLLLRSMRLSSAIQSHCHPCFRHRQTQSTRCRSMPCCRGH